MHLGWPQLGRVHGFCCTGQAISTNTNIVDTGATMRELMELLLSREMDLIVHDRQHGGWCNDCSPDEIS